MAGSELYISEMLENFQINMEKMFDDLSESMNSMAEKMESTVAAIGKVVTNTAQSVSTVSVVASDNEVTKNTNSVFSEVTPNTVATHSTPAANVFKSIANGSLRVKGTVDLTLKGSTYHGNATVSVVVTHTDSTSKKYTFATVGSSATSATGSADITVEAGDIIGLSVSVTMIKGTTSKINLTVPVNSISICCDMYNLMESNGIIPL